MLLTCFYIAPPATPLQDFTYHWKQLMNFYVNRSSNDSKVLVELTGIPRHLERLLELLIDEEKQNEEPGPCLEYLLQNRLLDLLANLACAETPLGMRLVCLSFFRRLLTRFEHPLLHHAAVYNPVQKLIVVCNGKLASPIENEEIQFLLCLCFLVCKYPQVTSIVNDPGENFCHENEDIFLHCNVEKNEIEWVTYVPTENIKNNPLFKPLDTQAITLVNPNLFKTKSTNKETIDKSSSNHEKSHETKSSNQHASTRSDDSSTRSISESSKDAENAFESSSSLFTCTTTSRNIPNTRNNSDDTQENDLSDKVPEQSDDPELAVLDDDFKDTRLEVESPYEEETKNGSKHDINLSPKSPRQSKCLLLDSLKSYVNSADNMIRIRACEGIMVLASLDDPLFAEIVAKSDLSLVLAKRLEFLFNQIPAHVEPTEIEDIEVTWGLDSPPLLDEKKFSRCRRVAAFFMWLDYCAQLSKEAHPDVAVVLATTIRITFFEKIVTIALGAHHAVLITALIAKCFRDVSSSPLSIELSRWLIDKQQDPEIPDSWSNRVVNRLIENCRSSSDDLIVETLKLFEELIEKRDDDVLHCLVLSYLNSRGYYDNSGANDAIASWSDEEDERERETKSSLDISQGTGHSRTLAPSNIHRILNCFLSLLPKQLQTTSNGNYVRYMDDWENKYSTIVKNCSLLAWPLEAVNTNESSDPISNEGDSNDSFDPGPFINHLLEMIDNIPRQKYEINLHLTLLITKLALLPHPYLHEFLLNPLIPVVPGKKSLFICLQRVVKHLAKEVPKLTDYKRLLEETRRRIFGEFDSQDTTEICSNYSPKKEDILLESVIIVEEFCKELAAIAYVKYHCSM